LPKRFMLCVTRVDHPGLEGCTAFHPGKNPETTLRAFLSCPPSLPHQLVFVGRRVREYLLHVGFTSADFEGVHFLGFINHEDMPKLYNLAELFVIPSFYEGCPSTLLEAMACGCPVVASQSGACPDLGDGAPVLANPYDPSDFATKITSVLTNEVFRQELKRKSLERAASFSWERTAKLTLAGLIRAARSGQVEDRRQHLRLPVHYFFTVQGTAGKGVVLDLSVDGCRVESSTYVQLGRELGLSISLPNQRNPLAVDRARVQWGHGHQFGLSFMSLHPEEHDRLRRMVVGHS